MQIEALPQCLELEKRPMGAALLSMARFLYCLKINLYQELESHRTSQAMCCQGKDRKVKLSVHLLRTWHPVALKIPKCGIISWAPPSPQTCDSRAQLQRMMRGHRHKTVAFSPEQLSILFQTNQWHVQSQSPCRAGEELGLIRALIDPTTLLL